MVQVLQSNLGQQRGWSHRLAVVTQLQVGCKRRSWWRCTAAEVEQRHEAVLCQVGLPQHSHESALVQRHLEVDTRLEGHSPGPHDPI